MGLINRSRISQSNSEWEVTNHVVSEPVANCPIREDLTFGLISATRKPIRPPSGESPSKVALTLPALLSRRSVSRPSSPTPVLESASESNSKKNNKRITCFVPRDGGMSFCDENDEVLVKGFGRSGHSVGDLPGVRFLIS